MIVCGVIGDDSAFFPRGMGIVSRTHRKAQMADAPLGIPAIILAHIFNHALCRFSRDGTVVGRSCPGDFGQVVFRYKMKDQVFCSIIIL